jgi:hypothetical protein
MAVERRFEENIMTVRDAAEIIEHDVLPTIETMATTFKKVAEIHSTKAAESSANGSGQQDGQKHAQENAQIISAFRSNEVASALQLAHGNKAAPTTTPGFGQSGSSNHRQGQ